MLDSKVYNDKIDQAKLRAAKLGVIVHVAEMDQGEDRTLCFVRDGFLDTEEFNAFNGLVLASVNPDGTVEY